VISVDTNVLARLFVTDDLRQHAIAKAFFAQRTTEDPVFVSTIVVVELAWLLEKTFDYRKSDIVAAVGAILDSPDFVVERHDVLGAALDIASNSKASVADAIIAAVAAAEGARVTMTFDVGAARDIPGMELLK
jgi:predicted nucleic-acid-binding protein